MIAVIAGATGLVGSVLLSKLLDDKAITQVIAIARRPLAINHSKLSTVIIFDFSNLSTHQEQLRGDIYFCALGTTIKVAGTKENFRKVDFDAVVNFGKIAALHQAKSFTVVSANMANPNSNIFYNKIKGEAEEALKQLALNRLVILRPGLLIGERIENRTGEKIAIALMNALSPILPERFEKNVATQVETLASRMLKEGQNPIPKIKTINAVDI